MERRVYLWTNEEGMPKNVIPFKGIHLPEVAKKHARMVVVCEDGNIHLLFDKEKIHLERWNSSLNFIEEEQKMKQFPLSMWGASKFGSYLGLLRNGHGSCEQKFYLNLDKNWIEEKADVIMEYIINEAISRAKGKIPKILYGKDCMIWDAGNRYTTVCWKEGAIWHTKTEHLWESGSPKMQGRRDIWYNPNTGASEGGVWKIYRRPNINFANTQETCEWIWNNQDSESHSLINISDIDLEYFFSVVDKEEKPFLLKAYNEWKKIFNGHYFLNGDWHKIA